MERLFLSHSHGDHELAAALKLLIESCFPGHIEVKASSSAPSEGGISAGSEWLDWIQEQVRGRRSEGLAALRQVRALGPEPAAIDSIRRGLIRLHKGLGGTDEELSEWLQALAGR